MQKNMRDNVLFFHKCLRRQISPYCKNVLCKVDIMYLERFCLNCLTYEDWSWYCNNVKPKHTRVEVCMFSSWRKHWKVSKWNVGETFQPGSSLTVLFTFAVFLTDYVYVCVCISIHLKICSWLIITEKYNAIDG